MQTDHTSSSPLEEVLLREERAQLQHENLKTRQQQRMVTSLRFTVILAKYFNIGEGFFLFFFFILLQKKIKKNQMLCKCSGCAWCRLVLSCSLCPEVGDECFMCSRSHGSDKRIWEQRRKRMQNAEVQREFNSNRGQKRRRGGKIEWDCQKLPH